MGTGIRLVRSAALSDVAEYAYAATVERGARLVFLAGACPLEADGRIVAVGDYAGQAARCIETLTEALRAAGATIEDVVSTRVLVASSRQSDLGAAWAVVRDAFGHHDVPSTLEGSRFRRQSIKWHDGLRGEKQKWVRHAGSSRPSIRPKL